MTRAHNRLNLLLVVAVDVVVVVAVVAATHLGHSDLVATPMPRRQPLPVLLLLRIQEDQDQSVFASWLAGGSVMVMILDRAVELLLPILHKLKGKHVKLWQGATLILH